MTNVPSPPPYKPPRMDTGAMPTVLRIFGWLGIIGAFIGGAVMQFPAELEAETVGSSIMTCVLLYAAAAAIDALRRIETYARPKDGEGA